MSPTPYIYVDDIDVVVGFAVFDRLYSVDGVDEDGGCQRVKASICQPQHTLLDTATPPGFFSSARR
jgi:hypothetical protein